MKKLILVRHGETDFNREHRLQGQLDVPLNSTGVNQAKKVSLALRSETFSAIWSSPLSRSLDTALSINRFHNAPLLQLDLLMERSFGSLEGQPQDQLKKRQTDASQTFDQFAAPEGESLIDLSHRSQKLLTKLYSFSGECLLLVGHAGLFRALIGLLLDWDVERWTIIPQDNTCINSFMFDEEGRVTAYQLNESEHNHT